MQNHKNIQLWKETLTILEQWKHLGTLESRLGSIALGHKPEFGQLYFLHSLYAPLSFKKVREMELSIGKVLPHILRSFYQIVNGLRLFRTLSIYGYCFDFDKVGQPISIRYGNVVEVPKGLPKNAIVIGGMEIKSPAEIGYIVALEDDRIILSAARDRYEPIHEWENIFQMVHSEVNRIAPFFNKDGICENEELFLRG